MLTVPKIIASGFGSGFSPKAPGTAGSLAAVIVWLATCFLFGGGADRRLSLIVTATLVTLSVSVGLWAVRTVLRHDVSSPNDAHLDPQWIVIDEWAGMFIALFGVFPNSVLGVGVAFALFRIFDASKVGWVGSAERLPGATGVMADDLVAGVFAMIGTQALLFISGWIEW